MLLSKITRLNDYSISKPTVIAALTHVYDNYLIKPYADSEAWRGAYIDQFGKFYPDYPEGSLVEEGGIYRPNHGLAHNVRVVSKVSAVVNLYVGGAYSQLFSKFTKNNITKLEIVAAFFVAGRGSEAGWSLEPDSPYQRYRKASSEAFYAYAKKLGREIDQPLFTNKELNLYKEVLIDPYFDSNKDVILLQDEKADISSRKQAAAKAILSACHALDLARCFGAEKMNEKIHDVSAPLGDQPYHQKVMAVASLFSKSEIQHYLTGDNFMCSFTGKVFVNTFFDRSSLLFTLSSTNPEICIRLVSLSRRIDSIQKAKSLAAELNDCATLGTDRFLQLLSSLETSDLSVSIVSQSIAPFLKRYSEEELAVLEKLPRLYRNKRAYQYTKDIIDIDPSKVSKANIAHLEQQLRSGMGLSERERAKKGAALLSSEEQKLVNEIFKTQWTLKHITQNYHIIREKGDVLKSLQQRIREDSSLDNKNIRAGMGKDDGVFFTLGSPQHKGVEILQRANGYVISIDINHFSINGKPQAFLSGLQFSDHWFKYINKASVSRTYGNTKREMKVCSREGNFLSIGGHKEYHYYRADGSLLTRTARLGQEAVIGEDIFHFIAYNLVLELRYIGGSYRSHILNNLDKRDLIEAGIDSFYCSDYFEVTIPSQVQLQDSHITVVPQNTNLANTPHNALLMHEAISKFDLDQVKSLLEKGVSIDICDSEEKTPLIHALLIYRFEIAAFLIEQGACCEKEYQGHSALAIAILRGRRDILEKMLTKFIKVDERDTTLTRQIDINQDTTAISLGIGRGYLGYFLTIGLEVEKFSPFIMEKLSTLNELMAINSIKLLFEHGAIWNYGKDKVTDHLLAITLLNAIHGRKLALLEYLIQSGCNVNVANLHRDHKWFGMTPLILAVKSGSLEAVSLLVESGAKINAFDNKGDDALSVAEKMHCQDIVKFLSAQLNQNKITAFQGNNKEIAKALVLGKRRSGELCFLLGQKNDEKTYELLSLEHNQQDFREESLEQLAKKSVFSGALIDLSKHLTNGNVERELLNHFQGTENNESLVIETHKYWVHDIKQLRPYPTDTYSQVRWIDEKYILSGDYLISGYDRPMIEAEIKNQPLKKLTYLNHLFQLNDQLFVAIKEDDLQAVIRLIAEGADINCRNDKKLSPLVSACDTPYHNLELIQTLINNGAKVNQACSYGDQELVPLQLALLHKSKALIILLGQQGANPNQIVGASKLTPLLTACELERTEFIDVLLDSCGADFKAIENKEALTYLCLKQCSEEMFDYLLDRADINGQGPLVNQLTPLMVCTHLGVTNRMQKLLDKGADASIRHPLTLKTALDFSSDYSVRRILCDPKVNDSPWKDVRVEHDINTYYKIAEQNEITTREQLLRDEFCLIDLEQMVYTRAFLYQIAQEAAPANSNIAYELVITTQSDQLIRILPAFNTPVIAIHKDFLTQSQYSVEELKFALAIELETIQRHVENLWVTPDVSEQFTIDQVALCRCQNIAAAFAYLRSSAAYKSEDSDHFRLPDSVLQAFSNSLKPDLGERIKRLEAYLAKNTEFLHEEKQSSMIDQPILDEINALKDKTFFTDEFPHDLSPVEQINYLTNCLSQLTIEVIPYELSNQPSVRVKEFCSLLKTILIDLSNKETYQAIDELIRRAFDLRISAFERIYDAICNTNDKRNIYIMSELPDNANKYIYNYVFLNKKGSEKLFYVKKNLSYEQVKIKDVNKFTNTLKKIITETDENSHLIHLNNKQIKELINSNGGYVPRDYIPLTPFNSLTVAIKNFIHAETKELAKQYATEVQQIYFTLSTHFNSNNVYYRIDRRGQEHLVKYIRAQDSKNKKLPLGNDRYFGSNIADKIDWPTFQKQNSNDLPWNNHLQFLDEANPEEFELIVQTLEMLGVTDDFNIWERLSDNQLSELIADDYLVDKKKIVRLPPELAEYTDNDDYRKRQEKKETIVRLLVNRSSSFYKKANFEVAFKEFYDENIYQLRIFSGANKTLNIDNEAVHILLYKFADIAQKGTEQEKNLVKRFFLNRPDHRDLAHLQKGSNNIPRATLCNNTPYIQFIMEQRYDRKTFQLFSRAEILEFYHANNVSFYTGDVLPKTWLEIFKSELPSSDLTLDSLEVVMPLLDSQCDNQAARSMFEQYLDSLNRLPLLSKEATALVKLALTFFKLSGTNSLRRLLSKLDWPGLPEENSDNAVTAEELICLYRVHDSTLKFPSEDKQKLLGHLVLSAIKNTTFMDEKINLLEQLLFISSDYFNSPLKDVSFRNEVVALWVESIFAKYGRDDGSHSCYLDMKNILDRINNEVSTQDKRRLFSNLANAIESQVSLSDYMGEIIDPQATKRSVQKDTLLMVLGKVIQQIAKNEPDKEKTLDFLASPLTESTLNSFTDHVMSTLSRDALRKCVEVFYGGEDYYREIDKNDVQNVLMIIYQRFWDLSLEERAGVINYLCIPADKVLTQEIKREAYAQTFKYATDKLFPNAETDAEEDFAKAFLIAYLETADPYQCEYLLAGMIVTTNEVDTHGEAPGPGRKLALLCEHLGPAYVKLAQAIHSHPKTPKNIRRDLDHIKGRANPPHRWDLWRLINRVLLSEERENIGRLGELLGSASYNLAIACTLKKTGENVVLLLLRDNAAKDAYNGFIHLRKAVHACEHSTLHSDKETVLDMIAEAEEMSSIEMDRNSGDKQHKLADRLYHDRMVTIPIENTDYQIKFASTKTLSSGKGYRFLNLMEGTEFNDLPSTTNQDKAVRKAIATAIIKKELIHILSGDVFDCDRHGNQLRVKIDKNNEIWLGLFDFGEMSLEKPSQIELQQFANILHALPDAFHKGISFDELFNQHIKSAKQANQPSNYLMRIRKAFLALQDFQKELSSDELFNLLKSINPDDVNALLSSEINTIIKKMQIREAFFALQDFKKELTPIKLFNLLESINTDDVNALLRSEINTIIKKMNVKEYLFDRVKYPFSGTNEAICSPENTLNAGKINDETDEVMREYNITIRNILIKLYACIKTNSQNFNDGDKVDIKSIIQRLEKVLTSFTLITLSDFQTLTKDINNILNNNSSCQSTFFKPHFKKHVDAKTKVYRELVQATMEEADETKLDKSERIRIHGK